MAFLIFFIILLSIQARNVKEIETSNLADDICRFLRRETLSTPMFEEFGFRAAYLSKKLPVSMISNRLTSLLNHTKLALLAVRFESAILMKPKCCVCERTIARNHRTVVCKSYNLQFHFNAHTFCLQSCLGIFGLPLENPSPKFGYGFCFVIRF